MTQGPYTPPPMQPQPPFVMPPPRSKALAITAMVFGIIGLVPLVGGLFAVVGLILGIVALARHAPGRGMATTGVVTGAVGLLLGALGMAGMLFWRSARVRPGPTGVFKCAVNLNAIGKGMMLYMAEYNDAPPPDLDHLVKTGLASPNMFKCPSANSGRSCDYFYLAPAKDAPSDTLVACDGRDNHRKEGGRNVLYFGGAVKWKWMEERDFQAELALPRNARFAAGLKEAEGP